MAEPTQYAFDLSEVAEALIKANDIHEGLWTLSFDITVAVGTFGPSTADAKPGAMMQIAKVQLVRQSSALPDAPNLVDAAKVNPGLARKTRGHKK
jgi:hypothetical protein